MPLRLLLPALIMTNLMPAQPVIDYGLSREQLVEQTVWFILRGMGLKEIGNVATDAAVRVALEEEDGNLRRAAERLGVTDRALQMRRAARRREEEGPPEED